MINSIRSFIIGFFALILMGCASNTVSVDLKASPMVNPDVSEKALPVQVVIYQLSDPTAFQQATFRQLWLQDKQTLGASMLGRQVITMAPNSKQDVEFEKNKKAKYVGTIAIFRHPNEGQWRALEKMPSGFWFIDGSATIELNQSTITLK